MAQGAKPKVRLGYCLFGAKTIRKLAKRLEKQIEGAKIGEDIEYVHRMRVASRRLRAAMPVFKHCFRRKSFKKWLKRVKKITRSMGEARDLDVQIAFLEEYLEKLGDDPSKTGVEFLLASHRERRASIQPDLVTSLDGMKESTFLRDMKRACRKIMKADRRGRAGSHDLFSRAHYHIARRIDELMEASDCVHEEMAKAKHHKMRIKSKRLRYTMEIFSKIYPEQLKEEISTMKKFQDALGDMHDYDVWMEYLPNFIKELGDGKVQKEYPIEDIEAGLTELFEQMGNLRRSRYLEFVNLWEKAEDEDFFDELRVKVQRGMFAGNGDLSTLSTSRVGIMADIHGNLPALEAVLQDAGRRGLIQFINAGDSLGYGVYPNQVIELLSHRGVLSIKGNYDLKALRAKGESGDPVLKLVKKSLSNAGRSFLKVLPERVNLYVDGKELLMVHSITGSNGESVSPENIDSTTIDLAGKGVDIVVMAHTHIPFSREVDGVVFVNPGSVGRPYDGNHMASYAILTPETSSIEIVRVDYDLEKLAKDMRKSGLPEKYAQALLQSLPLKKMSNWNEKLGTRPLHERMKELKEATARYGETDGHSEQVRWLALKLFDQLREIHNLERDKRYLLEAAATLHDIGWSESGKAHHKVSLRLILNDQDLPLTTRERLMIGSIARYHRKKMPKKKHTSYGQLMKRERRVVKALSALLRVADGMDFGHCSVVSKIATEFDGPRVLLICTGRGDHYLEDRQVAKKKDLFEKFFGKTLKLKWRS